jgi:hypothetical protein
MRVGKVTDIGHVPASFFLLQKASALETASAFVFK